MSFKIFNCILFLLLFSSSFSQNLLETRTASLNDGDYSLDGTVYLELFDDNSLNLRFDNDYQTLSNVYDVHVYLSNTNDYTSPIDTSNMLLVENIGTISGINYSSGSMTFNLPSNIGINDYQYIVFVCVQFGQLHWGDGTFGSSVLSISDIELNLEKSIQIKNPVTNGMIKIDLANQVNNVLIQLYNYQGQLVYSTNKKVINNQIGFTFNQKGTYFINLKSNHSSVTKQVVIL